MGKTRPGIDRITKQQLQIAKRGWVQAISGHDARCIICTMSGSDVYARCPSWWDMARRLHQVNRKLVAYDQLESPGDQMLPGMDEL